MTADLAEVGVVKVVLADLGLKDLLEGLSVREGIMGRNLFPESSHGFRSA